MKLNVLFLHGLVQTPEMLSESFSNLNKSLSKILNITYLKSPYELKNFPAFCKITSEKTDEEIKELEKIVRENYYRRKGKKNTYGGTWFFTDSDGNYSPQLKNVKIIGLEESLDFVLNECKRTNCDGLLGFSQGSLISAILAKKTLNDPTLGWKAKFCILFSSPMPYATSLNTLLTSGDKIKTPSLHILGKSDVMVPNHRSLLLTECFVDPIIHYHEGGHDIPHSDDVSVYENFLSKFL
ncbi:uncharacterized protein TA19095 [Theileria annulata]|uniref:Serine hydrolase domain-containing protein n=1 Tax=Theileria annulata TaxID=5874 RepID=Q4UG98_THEAN|nr:uncharacterized protein TA19095 [Theileria annulata]CAI73891.1 hypothetical protein, conserved [Theileria annulata]|eukprot:XP_954568.1 hypothetical protein, conserved [Theileria annulata]